MERHGTSSICSSAKETRVSDDLIYQTTAKELRMRKETRGNSFENETDQNNRHFRGENVKFAMAKETSISGSDNKVRDSKETAR